MTDTVVCISENEKSLADLINEYRTTHGLQPVTLSASLTEVAQLHVRDLIEKKPYDENGKCNMHSWSKGEKWSGCCYNSGDDGDCMWNKPREINSYQGDGYEIVMAQFNSQFPDKEVSALDALNSWKKSPRHNAVLLNKEIWKSTEYKAMGVGIYKGFAAVWLGEELDFQGEPNVCSN
ncbi:CAP domain-containing protein [Cryomorpha ignava]|uniref:CAP domain-containing protein n=1 Tax=Cryomorpha ignava TaxID=101383 RepID=A0A7K3WVD6_9FLAO|nr:CAP domain-containing protein [Cryomorpha ignava]NEN25659.1 CAP domain-containing protein [Cryomorpha ignava]